MLKLVLPKGSLEKATMEVFSAANLAVRRFSARSYRAAIDDPRISEVYVLRPQEIPEYVADGLFDLGITGRDWILETGRHVVSLGELPYSKSTGRPIRLVLAVDEDSSVETAEDFRDGVRVSTEYPGLTRKYFDSLGIAAQISFSYGATEAKVPDIVDAVVDVTETGSSLKAANLRVIDTLVNSYTELIANADTAASKEKLHAMRQIYTLLSGVLTARGKVLVKINVPSEALAEVTEILPCMKAPTVNELFEGKGYAVEAVVPRDQINVLIPELHDLGATDILEMPITMIVP